MGLAWSLVRATRHAAINSYILFFKHSVPLSIYMAFFGRIFFKFLQCDCKIQLFSNILILRILVSEGIIHPVVSALALTWFIRYIYNWNLQFLNNVIILKLRFSSLIHRWPQPILAILFRPFGFIERSPLYNKSLSIKGSLIFSINE
jgi:hypothetical protein